MAIREAEKIGGSTFFNVKAAASEPAGGTLCVFRIVDWENEEYPPLNEDYGWTMPFVYDVIAIPLDEDGEQDGEPVVWLRQDMRFGQNPMWVLRGHSRPEQKVKRRELPAPVNEVGDEIIGRLVTRERGKGADAKSFPVLNKASKDEKALALKVRESLGGDAWGQDGDGDLF
jgi:hypothetical protein